MGTKENLSRLMNYNILNTDVASQPNNLGFQQLISVLALQILHQRPRTKKQRLWVNALTIKEFRITLPLN